ncbi:hypothetical protein C8R44DRAFT_901142 [Mycena epipterygia]|nr:hypothetical protein C8R44DRAFT_901142 [Mycena epipterygia]
MHIPQSSTPTASPLSYTSAKLSHHGQPLSQWTHQHPPPATPWMQCVSLPRPMTPSGSIFAAESYNVPAPFGHYPLGAYAPSMPPVPLPYSSPLSSSSSRHTSHSSRTSPAPLLHPLLSSHRMEFLIHTYPFTPDSIRVPQDLKEHQLGADAFHPPQNYIQIRLTADTAINPLVVQATGSLSVARIVRSLHEHIHTSIPRQQFSALKPETQAIAQRSFAARCASGRVGRDEGIKLLDVLGFGTKSAAFVGLKKGDDANEWVLLTALST